MMTLGKPLVNVQQAPQAHCLIPLLHKRSKLASDFHHISFNHYL